LVWLQILSNRYALPRRPGQRPLRIGHGNDGIDAEWAAIMMASGKITSFINLDQFEILIVTLTKG
jgi:hypothetical protein